MNDTHNPELAEPALPAKLETETKKAYQAFCAYLEMRPGERSLSKLTPKGTSLNSAKKWSTKHNWVERAAAYDLEKANLVRQEAFDAQVREVEKMVVRDIQLTQGFADKIEAMLAQIQPGGEDAVNDLLTLTNARDKQRNWEQQIVQFYYSVIGKKQ